MVEETEETVKIFAGNTLVYAGLKMSKDKWLVRYNIDFFVWSNLDPAHGEP